MQRKNTFIDVGAGFLPVIAVAVIAAMLAAASPFFFMTQNLENMIRRFGELGIMACAIAVTVRAKGPDFSIPGVLCLTGVTSALLLQSGAPWGIALLIGLLIAAGIGFLNGVVIIRTPLPAPVATLISCAVIRVILRLAVGKQFIEIEDWKGLLSAFPLPLFFGIAVGAAIALIFFTKLGVPFSKRGKNEKNRVYIWAYVFSAVCAGIYGFMVTIRLHGANANIGWEGFTDLALWTAALYASTALDNRFAPVPYALGVMFLWTIMVNLMNLFGVSTFWQDGLLIAVFVPLAVFAIRLYAKQCAGRLMQRE
ncbi:MAG: ABC transporter permease [Christensenella sp.]|nr:ABC transporter permease [Christensenella sp.]